MDTMDTFTWLCLAALAAAGIANLAHSGSSLVIRQDLRERLPKKVADQYQTAVGCCYLVAAAIAAAMEYFVQGGNLYIIGMAVAAFLLIGGTIFCNNHFLSGTKK